MVDPLQMATQGAHLATSCKWIGLSLLMPMSIITLLRNKYSIWSVYKISIIRLQRKYGLF